MPKGFDQVSAVSSHIMFQLYRCGKKNENMDIISCTTGSTWDTENPKQASRPQVVLGSPDSRVRAGLLLKFLIGSLFQQRLHLEQANSSFWRPEFLLLEKQIPNTTRKRLSDLLTPMGRFRLSMVHYHSKGAYGEWTKLHKTVDTFWAP